MTLALDQVGALNPKDLERLNKLEEELDALLPEGIRPSLLHGDLWSGNVHGTKDRGIAMIDPVPFYGDAYFEIGMMRLFGGFSRVLRTGLF